MNKMSSSQITPKNKDDQKRQVMIRRPFDELFDTFRHDIEDAFFAPFMNPLKTYGMTPGMDFIETRVPLCDIVDNGDKYIISLEVPGIQKDKIELKATEEYLSISGIDEKKNEKEEENYVLRERSYKSFSRKIPFTENIIPAKVDATVENGILKIELPKQNQHLLRKLK
ncbi:MAG: Hsp20/alpha crystallin family protein [Nitrososphaeraceae archaeon]|nr:Hsp20/alpha crystallin family protein [Nitrososphaeraceae archaeon]